MRKNGKTEGKAPKVREISGRLRKQINDLRKPFSLYQSGFSAMNEKREDLAPRFMAAYHQFAKENGGSFPDFVRELDPTVPVESRGPNGYLKHSAFMAATYLRRLKGRRDKGKNRAQPARNNTEIQGRLIATCLQTLKPSEVPAFWEGFEKAFHLSKRQITTLQTYVEGMKPLFTLHVKPQAFRLIPFTARKAAAKAA